MKQPDYDSDFLDNLSNEGWKSMEVLLKEQMPQSPKTSFFKSKYKIAATIVSLLLLTTATLLFFNDHQPVSQKTTASQKVPAKVQTQPEISHITPESKEAEAPSLHEAAMQVSRQAAGNQVPAYLLTTPSILAKNTIFVSRNNKHFLDSLANESIKRAMLREQGNSFSEIPLVTEESGSALPPAKNIKTANNKLKIFAGAGVNISGNMGVSLENTNVHPSVTAVFSLGNKWDFHAGISAFSALHGSYKNAGEKEYVNSAVDNILYKINTTSVVKLKYIDLPLALHYKITNQFSAGAGIQFSHLNRMDVKEKKESFDYNDNLLTTETQRFSSNASTFGAYEKKIDARNWDSRLLLEAKWKKNRFLISAGYLHGINPAVDLLQTDGSRHEYHNRYFKFGVQYQIK